MTGRARDAAAAGTALAIGLGWLALAWSDPADRPATPIAVELLAAAAVAVAVAALRRRHALAAAFPLVLAAVPLTAAMGGSVVAVYAVASRRSWRATAAVLGWQALLFSVAYRTALADTRTWVELTVLVVLVHVVAAAIGVTARSRADLVGSLRERARQAEEGQRLRVEEARHTERERIAREMHDVLAHRLSLLAVHAGALEFRPGAGEQERQALGVVRQGAYEALEDLREVLGMLRAEPAEGDRPQPTLADLPALVEESRLAGASVRLDRRVDGDVPGSVGRHAYRVVQEALTNARKHAGGAPVRVSVAGNADAGLTVAVTNPLVESPAVLPGGGTGLVGLAERVRLLGGRLEHGRTGDTFRLQAWLPWPS
jgi:signal transduction histidine kinase